MPSSSNETDEDRQGEENACSQEQPPHQPEAQQGEEQQEGQAEQDAVADNDVAIENAENLDGNSPSADDAPNDDALEAEAAEAIPPFLGFDVDSESSFENKDMTQVLQLWEAKHNESGYDPVPALSRLAEIFEKETEIYMRKDPDPFDERHPYRTDPSCQFGFLLKQLFRKDHFMFKLVNEYTRDNYFTRQSIQKSSLQLNIIAARLILDIMPGLETAAVFQVQFDDLINRIYRWATDSIEPLQSYATGLLASAMEVNDIAVSFREANARLVPKMIIRLHILQAFHKSGRELKASLDLSDSSAQNNENSTSHTERNLPVWMAESAPQSPQRLNDNGEGNNSSFGIQSQHNGTLDSFPNTSNMSVILENSRDAFPGNGARYYKKMYIPIHPPTAETSQMLIMRYLTSMGEYQEFLGLIFEHNVMQLIFGCISNLDRRDTCLAFEALKYLASLLCHKKFALAFIANGGLELLLKVPRPSIAATGVSITLYYLAYSEDAMERICTMPKTIISQLVHYALWILGRSYDSGKCHATMFFGLSFQFKVILDEFDSQDGLRKLYNVISILKILNPTNNDDDENNAQQNEDVECASRQLVRHVCVALKRYMESHLFYKYNAFMRLQNPTSSEFSPNITKAAKVTLEQISDQIRILQENTSVRAHWSPVDQLLKLGGVTMLLKIITLSYEWNYSGRSETVRSALDVLSICAIIPKVFPAFCDRLDLQEYNSTSGISSVLGAAAGEITADAEVQKSALALICHCVCSPIARREPYNQVKMFSASRKQKQNNKYSEDLIESIWEAVCSSNGIIGLLSLVQIKNPITDADCIRGMACRALAGLARSERVRQIISKLPLFASGQIQTLMRDPILQEKRAEHLLFQKYALELLERISGKVKPRNNQLDSSLSNIHKANVVVQTKIQYNEQQLLQLIHDHLESKGMSATAQMLQKEAGLQQPSSSIKSLHQSPFDYKIMPAPVSISRNRIRNRIQELNNSLNETTISSMETSGSNSVHIDNNQDQQINQNGIVTPIKLVKKTDKSNPGITIELLGGGTPTSSCPSAQTNYMQRSLEKQISVQPNDTLNNLQAADDSPQFVNSNVTLSTIVTEYLTNQHALCNNPMTTCPQFDLFAPHKCPDPKPNRIPGTNNNLTARIFDAQAGFNTTRLDRRFVHTHFAPWRTIRSSDYTDVQFTCCDIVHSSNLLLVGTKTGEAKAFNINDGSEQFSAVCHNYLVDSILSNRAGDLVVTTCVFNPPNSIVWSVQNNEFVSKLRLNEEFYCEFSNTTQDKLLGTRNNAVVIYDIATGAKISTLTPTIANQYTRNCGTFNPTDELILSDGVLWDVRSGKEIHKFDKLNENLSGVFHPNGLEIISNTEVWDLRTFHLLQTVPVLNQCLLKFSPMRVIYATSLENNRIDFDDTTDLKTSFKVLDLYDYSSISTIDVKRSISDLSVNENGSLLALLESPIISQQDTCVKLYAVGMKKNDQQEEVGLTTSSNPSSSVNSFSSEHAAAVARGPQIHENMGRPTAAAVVRRLMNYFDLNVSTAASSNGGVGVVLNRHAAPRPSAAGGTRRRSVFSLNTRTSRSNIPPIRLIRIDRDVGDGGDGIADNENNMPTVRAGAGAAAIDEIPSRNSNDEDDEDQDPSHSEDGSDSDGSNSSNDTMFPEVRLRDLEDSDSGGDDDNEDDDDDDDGDDDDDDDDSFIDIDDDDGDDNDGNGENQNGDDNMENDVDDNENRGDGSSSRNQSPHRRRSRSRNYRRSRLNFSSSSDDIILEWRYRF